MYGYLIMLAHLVTFIALYTTLIISYWVLNPELTTNLADIDLEEASCHLSTTTSMIRQRPNGNIVLSCTYPFC